MLAARTTARAPEPDSLLGVGEMSHGRWAQPAYPPRMDSSRRWLHVAGLLVVALLVGTVLVMLDRLGAPDPAPPTPALPAPTSSPVVPLPPSATPPPAPAVPAPATPAPAPPAPALPSVTVPSITVPPLPTCATPRGATPLRVLSFNIHGGRARGSYDAGLDQIVAEITAWDPDVVLLQEVHRFRRDSGFDDQPALLGRRLGMTVVFGRNFTRPPEGPGRPVRESGTAILSRLPIIESGNQPLPRYPGQEQRGLLHATVTVGDQEVRVYNTHLQHTAGNIRIVQARAVRDLVTAAGGAFVLGGDLNATPEAKPLSVLAKIATDPWPSVGVGEGLTVPPRAPRRRIDYVLHGGAPWVATQAQALFSAASDHRAVLVDLELPAADPCGVSTQGLAQ